jgi:CubicO group peptidase (beta-lactamase class C family)
MADAEIETAFQAAIDAGKINGGILCAADAKADFTYEKAIGERTLLSGEKKAHRADDVVSLASASKLLTTIAALQCVEDGLLSLTGDLSSIAPELAAQKVLTGFGDDGKPVFEAQKRGITLEMLLSHSSGLTYFFLDPLIARWKAQYAPPRPAGVKLRVEEMFDQPLGFQPGEGWLYGPGLDWAGRIVERVTGKTLGDYLHERVFAPLDINDAQFFPVTREDLRSRLVDLSPDDPDAQGRAVVGDGSQNLSGKGDFGGHGLFMTTPDYLKVLRSLLSNDGKILKPETVDNMFEHHLSPESTTALQAAFKSPAGQFYLVGTSPDKKAGYGLGGLVTLEGVDGWYGEGTMSWGGGLTLTWFIDRENGLCGVGAVLCKVPLNMEAAAELKQIFRKDIYRKWHASRG